MLENIIFLVALAVLLLGVIVLTCFLPWVGMFCLAIASITAIVIAGVRATRDSDIALAKASVTASHLSPHGSNMRNDVRLPRPAPPMGAEPKTVSNTPMSELAVNMSNLPVGEAHSMALFQLGGASLDGTNPAVTMAKRGQVFSEKEKMAQRNKLRTHRAEAARAQVEHTSSIGKGGGSLLYLEGEGEKYKKVKQIKQHKLVGGSKFTNRRLKNG
jgi:hypothetical protein